MREISMIVEIYFATIFWFFLINFANLVMKETSGEILHSLHLISLANCQLSQMFLFRNNRYAICYIYMLYAIYVVTINQAYSF